MKTLILCSANVCRSPAAEALWRAAAGERGLTGTVASAGLQARAGQAPSSTMVGLLQARGVVVPEAGAVSFNRFMARQYGLILVMEPVQQQQVLALTPELTGRVHLLGRWGQGTIDDPMGHQPMAYQHCLDQICLAVEAWMERLAPVRLPHCSARPEVTRTVVATNA